MSPFVILLDFVIGVPFKWKNGLNEIYSVCLRENKSLKHPFRFILIIMTDVVGELELIRSVRDLVWIEL